MVGDLCDSIRIKLVTTGKKRWHEHVEFDFDLDTAKDVSTAKPVSTAGAAVTTVSTADVSTTSSTRRVSIVDDITMAETLVYIRKSAAKDKGKGKMDESKPVQTKTKLQKEQERLGYEAVVRLQVELKEEERQRIVRVHEATSSFNVEEWEDIQARVKADEELAQRLQAKEREMFTEQARMLVELINQRKRYFAAQKAKERRNKPQQTTPPPTHHPLDRIQICYIRGPQDVQKRCRRRTYDSPLLRVNTLGSDEGSMTLQELMVFCTTLLKKVESLETDLKQTKQIYGAAYTRLIKKVKKYLEDPSKQGRKIAEIDQDPSISLVQHDVEIQGRYEHYMEFDFDFDATKKVFTAEKDISTAKPVSTAGAAVTTSIVAVSTVSPTRNTGVPTTDEITMPETMVYIWKSAVKDKGKGKMDKSETVYTKTKLQQEQERPGFEAAVRLQAELEEEERVQADEELVQRLQAEEKEKYTKADQERMLAELINQRKRYFAAQRAEERS
ncbi:hypothetical protein Tco_1380216 [Tanacetum coccineum]